ncbi:MAG: heavy-metal-associated domain-containing protein [Clostridia bacterium]|nr:heavy-metal-associated domain-containing protein [Clostridia bacterium]
MKANKFIVNGLTDASKIPDIKASIRSHDGINSVRVDMQANTVTVDYDEGRYNEGDIKNFVNETGLNVTQVK